MNDTIRKRVRSEMDRADVSTYQLAELVGMKQPNVTRVLTGRSGSIPDSWQKILDALDLELVVVPKGSDVSDLFGGEQRG